MTKHLFTAVIAKTRNLLFVILTLTSLQTLHARQERMPQFGAAHKALFLAIIEGLYTDGVTQGEVEKILLKSDPKGGYDHFIYACPICMPVLDAFRPYAQRPRFYAYKPGSHQVNNRTLGKGLDETIHAGLFSDDVEIRLKTVNSLITRWLKQWLKKQNLTAEEATLIKKQLKLGKEEGLQLLKSWQSDPEKLKRYAPGYANVKECAICKATEEMELNITEKKQNKSQ